VPDGRRPTGGIGIAGLPTAVVLLEYRDKAGDLDFKATSSRIELPLYNQEASGTRQRGGRRSVSQGDASETRTAVISRPSPADIRRFDTYIAAYPTSRKRGAS